MNKIITTVVLALAATAAFAQAPADSLSASAPAGAQSAFQTETQAKARAETQTGTWSVANLYSNEVALGYGRVSIPGTAMTIGGIFGAIFSFGAAQIESLNTTGAISGEYWYRVRPKFSVGAVGAVENVAMQFKNYAGKDGNGENVYKKGTPAYTTFYSLMPAIKWYYTAKPNFGVYSKLAVGAMAIHSGAITTGSEGNNGEVVTETTPASTSWMIAFQLATVGLDFGSPEIKGFVELGLGMQGLITAGIKYSF